MQAQRLIGKTAEFPGDNDKLLIMPSFQKNTNSFVDGKIS